MKVKQFSRLLNLPSPRIKILGKKCKITDIFPLADCDNVVLRSVWLVTYEIENEWAEKNSELRLKYAWYTIADNLDFQIKNNCVDK